jgi:ribonuclease VapC
VADVVLDASAVLAYLFDEPGHDRVEPALSSELLSSANLAEIIGKLIDHGASTAEAIAAVTNLGIGIAPVDLFSGQRAGVLREQTRGRNVSLADRFCLALAEQTGLPVMTADKAWTNLGLVQEIQLIR